jgi:hypothetical protein
MLLETSLVDPGSGEVWAIAAGPLLVSRVDRKGEAVKTPRFGRLMQIEVKTRHRPGERRTFEIDPAWPELLQAASEAVKKAVPALRVEVQAPNVLHCILPDDPLAVPADLSDRLAGVRFRAGSGLMTRILCSGKEKSFLVVGSRPFLGRGTFLLGEGVKVVSMAAPGRPRPPASSGDPGAETDIAFVEVRTGERVRKIVTVRWVKQLVRVLDRLGVDWAEVVHLLEMASEAGQLRAEIVKLSPKKPNFLQDPGEKVR